MLRLALRALHSYSSVGDIVGVEFELNGLVFGMIARGREVVEGRVVMQVRREENQVKQLRPPICRISGKLVKEISFKSCSIRSQEVRN